MVSKLPPLIPESEDIDFVREVEALGIGLKEATDNTGNNDSEMGESVGFIDFI